MRLLNPKVHSQSRKWCTEKQMLAILKKLKQKKYGFKDYAVDVEEVTEIPGFIKIAGNNVKLNPEESYFHVYVEYIV